MAKLTRQTIKKEDLAEFCGIHAGDGYMRNDGKRLEVDISGSMEESVYYDNHVIPLVCRLFAKDITGRKYLQGLRVEG